jgi:FKBP-type peptidyl-prolyl cis-trans isomerase SlyD
MQITHQKVVTIDYTLTDTSGEVLDSSEDDGPLSYLHGFGNIVPGLESALEGKATGDSLKVVVEPSDGYGVRDEKLVHAVPRDRFPKGEIEVGMSFHAEGNGEPRILTVVAVDDKKVTVDANHPLAGQKLAFDVTVRSIRDATEEELEHGHVHDGDDHDHDHDHDHHHGHTH